MAHLRPAGLMDLNVCVRRPFGILDNAGAGVGNSPKFGGPSIRQPPQSRFATVGVRRRGQPAGQHPQIGRNFRVQHPPSSAPSDALRQPSSHQRRRRRIHHPPEAPAPRRSPLKPVHTPLCYGHEPTLAGPPPRPCAAPDPAQCVSRPARTPPLLSPAPMDVRLTPSRAQPGPETASATRGIYSATRPRSPQHAPPLPPRKHTPGRHGRSLDYVFPEKYRLIRLCNRRA